MFKSFTEKLPASSKSSPRPGQPRGRSSGTGGSGPLAPEPPAPVRRAARFMLAGAAVSALSLILSVIGSFGLKSSMMSANAQKLKLHQVTVSEINNTANALIVYTIVIGLVSIGLWVWMARMNAAGRNWARITATVFFALWSFYSYSTIGQLHGGVTITTTFVVSLALVLALWVIGLAAVSQLWRAASTAYFKAQSPR